MRTSRTIFGGIVVLYFIIALEELVMISPFAAFFYSIFNPFLLFLARSPATRWRADFFLPHMVLPPGILLLEDGGELLTEGEVLKDEITPRAQPREEGRDQGRDDPEHGGLGGCRSRLEPSTILGATRFWRPTSDWLGYPVCRVHRTAHEEVGVKNNLLKNAR